MFVLLFSSCKKDETKIVADNGTAPALTTTAAAGTLVLTEENAEANIVAFNWTTSTFGFDGNVVSYTLQLGVAGKNFARPVSVSLGSALTTSMTVATLNSLVNQLSLKNGADGKVEVRIKAEISANYTPAYSNVIPLTVNPYQIIIDYPSLWVPGAYQNWTPPTAAKISSVDDNKMYEGYIYFADASEFKFTPEPNWDNDYGSNTGTDLVYKGGGNLKVTSPGYYLIKANTNALTWSAIKTTWSVLGSALNAETPLTYDPATKVWTVTKTLAAGTLKFRANGADTINFGSAEEANGKLVQNGVAIPVTEAGTYLITFNVSIPGNYVYSLEKQ